MLNTAKIIAILIVAGCIAWSNSVLGQTKESNEDLTKLRELQQETEQVQKQLGQIEQQALQENPGLQKMQTDLQQTYNEKLAEYDYPNTEEMQELRKMQRQLQNAQNMEAEERQALTQKFQTEVVKLQQAQKQARQDDEVVKKLKQYENAKLEAMKEESDNVDQLQQKMQQFQQKMQQLQQKVYGPQRQ